MNHTDPENLRPNLLVDEDYQLLSDYALFKEQGLGKESKNCVNLFLEKIKDNSKGKKRKLVRMLCNMQYRNMVKFLSYPLKEEFLKPLLLDWIKEEPQNSEPYKYFVKLSLYSNAVEELSLLRKSYALNSNDDEVLSGIFNRELDPIYYNTHYLNESRYFGDPHQDLELCAHILIKCDLFKDEQIKEHWLDEIKTYANMIQDWINYCSIDKKICSFPEYCLNINHDYGFGSIKKVYVKTQIEE